LFIGLNGKFTKKFFIFAIILENFKSLKRKNYD